MEKCQSEKMTEFLRQCVNDKKKELTMRRYILEGVLQNKKTFPPEVGQAKQGQSPAQSM